MNSLSLSAAGKEFESFNRVVGGGAKIFDFDVERVEVGDEGVLQGAPKESAPTMILRV